MKLAQELAKDFQGNKLKKELKYALIPTRMSSGKWIWMQNYFNLIYMIRGSKVCEDFLKGKVTFSEMIDIQHISTQGSPESKSAGGGGYYGDDDYVRPSRPKVHEEYREQRDDETNSDEWNSESYKPKQTVETLNFKTIQSDLRQVILGQDNVIEEVMKKIVRKSFVLSTDKKKPLSFFWAGPTGVGKTETALQLSKLLHRPMIRIDMSEYMHDHNVARLIGSPPGYVGHNQPGVLQECDGQNCIILVDEIEKADPQIFNIFLQILDYGSLTDGRNRQLDLSKCIIIMTSNVGAREMNERKMGLVSESSDSDKKNTVTNAMSKMFAPEFINRLSSIQVFNSLNDSTVKQIVDQQLTKIVASAKADYGVEVKLTEELVRKVYVESYNPLMGARPIHRAIEVLVLEPLSEKVMLEKQSGRVVLGE